MSKRDKFPWYKRFYVSVEGSMEESFGDFAPFFHCYVLYNRYNRALPYTFPLSFNRRG